LITGLGRQVL